MARLCSGEDVRPGVSDRMPRCQVCAALGPTSLLHSSFVLKRKRQWHFFPHLRTHATAAGTYTKTTTFLLPTAVGTYTAPLVFSGASSASRVQRARLPRPSPVWQCHTRPLRAPRRATIPHPGPIQLSCHSHSVHCGWPETPW